MRKLHDFIKFTAAAIAAALLILTFVPPFYGGANPSERILRMENGGNFITTTADAVAFAYLQKSAIFDYTLNGQNGQLIYTIDPDSNSFECYYEHGEANNKSASYISIKDGILYQFVFSNGQWMLKNNRVCLTNMQRLLKNLSHILTNQDVDTAQLQLDLNGLFNTDLTTYINFELLPDVLSSFVSTLEDESFLKTCGYSFNRDAFSLVYTFSAPDSKTFADAFYAIAKPAFTKTAQNMISIADFAGSIIDYFGFDPYSLLFDGTLTVATGLLSGKLQSFEFSSDNTTLFASCRKYGNCKISIESDELQALINQYFP